MTDVSLIQPSMPAPLPPPGEATADERSMATLAIVLAIFTNWIGPLIIYLLKKDQSTFIGEQAKEVLNFQITLFFAYLGCIMLSVVVIGFFLIPVVLISSLIFCIKGARTTNKGNLYRFPFTLRLVK